MVSSSASGISLAAASGLDSPALLTTPVSSTPAPTTDAPTSNPADDPPREAAQPKKPAVAPVVSPKLSRPRGWPTTSVRLKSILRRNVAPVGQSCGSPAPPDHSRHSAARGSTAAETPRKPRVAWAVPSSAAALAHDSGAGASSPVDCQTARKLRPRKSRSPPGSRASLATRLITTEPPVDVNRELRCKECNILFKSAKTFVAHLRTHNKKRPFQCDQCEASFTEYWSLRYHHFRHTGLKPFQCPVCSRKFRARDSLTQHVAGQHTRETRYTCPHCQEKFCYRAEFHRHKRLNRACRLEVSQSEK